MKKSKKVISKKSFKKLIKETLKFYEDQYKLSKKLEKIFGSDTQIFIEQNEKHIDRMIKIITEAVGDTGDSVDWLFYEVLMNNDDLSFKVNGKEYKGNIDNIYDLIQGKLDV